MKTTKSIGTEFDLGGFVRHVAHEIANPIQMRWDSRGRLWVSCSGTYPHIYPGNEPRDRLVILEDTKGTGKADKCTVFADNLHIPLSFEFGDTPRLDGRVRAPATKGLDLSLIKNVVLVENLRLQFRVEAFNLTNTVVFGLPNTTAGNPGFGVIGSQVNQPRNLQLALKLIW